MKDEAAVPGGSIASGGATCRIELVLVSTSYDILHMRVPSAACPVLGISNAVVSGRMARDRKPVGESTEVYISLVTDFGQRRKVSGAPREPMAPHWIAELISRRYLPLATVARKGENIVCSWNSAPGRAMCSEAAESRMLSNLAVCPDVVLNTTQVPE